VLRHVQKLIIVALLITAIGAHWGVLQGVAWAGMLIRYSQTETIESAWTKTFDGQHPCKLCTLVRCGKAAEKKQEMEKLESKFEFSFIAGTAWLFPPRPCPQFLATDLFGLARLEAPLTPPPRCA
jgi:hypothetical protein